MPELQIEGSITADDLQGEANLFAAFRTAAGMNANRGGPSA